MSTIFNKEITEIIKVRHSVRNYDNSLLPKEVIEKIKKYISTLENPFNKSVRIKLVVKDDSKKESKLGTYGVIKGANHFLVAACKNDDLSLMALGYTFEKLVLYCTSLGLSTVWLGGTFNKGKFEKAINLGEKEILPIVSPVGYEGGKKSLLASLIGSNTNKRKDYSDLFFNNNFSTPLEPNNSGIYGEAFEMLRAAPSALNKQPWRILKEDNNVHFYLTTTKGLTKIDIGIALCHFHLTAIEKGISGEFVSIDSNKNAQSSDLDYVISWINKL